jgi:hypothetical protein
MNDEFRNQPRMTRTTRMEEEGRVIGSNTNETNEWKKKRGLLGKARERLGLIRVVRVIRG